jgi:1-pyrroline-5-carboxylate dehydrogenase
MFLFGKAGYMEFKLTYATMFNPPEEMHERFDAALVKVKSALGKDYGMLINNREIFSTEKLVDHSPINKNWELAVMQSGNQDHAHQALDAARKAFPAWSHTPWQERIRLLRKAVQIIEERIYDLGAAMSLEVGKNRMESLGDVQEAADLIAYACEQMEKNNGYTIEMGRDPLVGFNATNLSVLKPYGVWLVISPFNFPFALTAGPLGSALAAGNTVIVKPASDSAWIVRLLVDCLRDAGLPDGVLNFVTGPGRTLGQALITCAVDGVTFTGSFEVGTRIFRDFSACNWIRPVLLEMGGKNAVIVSRNADLDKAATGIVRSAFGLQGQKCSAASRVYIDHPIYDEFVARLLEKTKNLVVGDPTQRNVYMGPVINETAFKDFQAYCQEISEASHRLWKYEMFLPITTIARVKDLDSAMAAANDVNYGLTAGFYGNEEETAWFFDHIQAGVAYVNRPQGATTGAWPGFQPFGGWKASGSSGKNAGGKYYLPLYMHEQVQTTIR